MTLDVWVIYDHPRDEPDYFVVRRQSVVDGEIVAAPHAEAFRTLEEARAAVPRGAVKIQGPGDDPDPVILEVYV